MIRARSEWVIRKRDGRVAPYDDGLIGRAIANAFRAELNLADGQPLDGKTDQEIREITEEVSESVADNAATAAGTSAVDAAWNAFQSATPSLSTKNVAKVRDLRPRLVSNCGQGGTHGRD